MPPRQSALPVVHFSTTNYIARAVIPCRIRFARPACRRKQEPTTRFLGGSPEPLFHARPATPRASHTFHPATTAGPTRVQVPCAVSTACPHLGTTPPRHTQANPSLSRVTLSIHAFCPQSSALPGTAPRPPYGSACEPPVSSQDRAKPGPKRPKVQNDSAGTPPRPVSTGLRLRRLRPNARLPPSLGK